MVASQGPQMEEILLSKLDPVTFSLSGHTIGADATDSVNKRDCTMLRHRDWLASLCLYQPGEQAPLLCAGLAGMIRSLVWKVPTRGHSLPVSKISYHAVTEWWCPGGMGHPPGTETEEAKECTVGLACTPSGKSVSFSRFGSLPLMGQGGFVACRVDVWGFYQIVQIVIFYFLLQFAIMWYILKLLPHGEFHIILLEIVS